jgi:hypothetical protein
MVRLWFFFSQRAQRSKERKVRVYKKIIFHHGLCVIKKLSVLCPLRSLREKKILKRKATEQSDVQQIHLSALCSSAPPIFQLGRSARKNKL